MKQRARDRARALSCAPHRMLGRFAGGSLSVMGVLAVIMLQAPAAQAASGSFCQNQGYIPGYTNCGVYVSYYTTSFSEAEAATYYPNDGNYVCAYVEVPNNHVVAKSCLQNNADTGAVYNQLFTNNYFHVGNDSPQPHYVRGYWQAQ